MATFCSNCGTAGSENANNCSNCGASIASTPTPSYAPSYRTNPGNTFSTIAIVLGAIAFLLLPIALGPAAIILAAVGKSKKESRSTVALAVAITGTVIGMIFGAIVGYLSARS